MSLAWRGAGAQGAGDDERPARDLEGGGGEGVGLDPLQLLQAGHVDQVPGADDLDVQVGRQPGDVQGLGGRQAEFAAEPQGFPFGVRLEPARQAHRWPSAATRRSRPGAGPR
jgi:hypothetical protein